MVRAWVFGLSGQEELWRWCRCFSVDLECGWLVFSGGLRMKDQGMVEVLISRPLRNPSGFHLLGH